MPFNRNRRWVSRKGCLRILSNVLKPVIIRAYHIAKLSGKTRGITLLPAGMLDDRPLYSE